MNFPLISIVMGTYNGEKFLRELIQSLLIQTYPNLEIIISDDCSTDSTLEILNTYNYYPHIKIFCNEVNLGFTKNFEKAALLANGEYIAFCDQDDIWLPEKIMELFNTIGNHSLVYSDSKLIDQDGNDLHKSLSDFKYLQDIYDVSSLAFHNVVSGHTMLIKKELLQAVVPMPDIHYHDWYIAVQAAKQNGCVYLDKQLTLYRQHPQTCTKTIKSRNYNTRSLSARCKGYLIKLDWLALLMHHSPNEQKAFLQKLYQLYLLNAQAIYNFKLFFFLLWNQKTLYRFSKKNFLSRLIDIRKHARGEKLLADGNFHETSVRKYSSLNSIHTLLEV